MNTIKIEILNPKALKLIESMQEQNLIRINEDSETKLKAYLKKSRKYASSAPSLSEINEIVMEVRQNRFTDSKSLWKY